MLSSESLVIKLMTLPSVFTLGVPSNGSSASLIRFPDVLAPIQHRVEILQFELRFLPYISIYGHALFIHDFSFFKMQKAPVSSCIFASKRKKEPSSRSLERTAPWYWLYKNQIEMVLQTSSSTGSSVLVISRASSTG